MYAYIFRGDCFTAEIQYSDFYTLSAPSSSVEWSALKQYTHKKKTDSGDLFLYIRVYEYIQLYICNNNQRKRGSNEGSWAGLKARKGRGKLYNSILIKILLKIISSHQKF